MNVEKKRNEVETFNAAFTAWLMGAGGEGVTFGKFLETYGIIEKNTESEKIDTKALKAKADRVIEMLKNRKAI